MPRPKNTENRARVARTAFGLFLELGYEETTYQAIAEGCGVKRAVVQHYFPTKTDLALGFFQTVLTETVAVLSEADPAWGAREASRNLFLVGQGFFGFLLKDARTRRLTLDILGSRVLTEEVLVFNFQWGMGFLGVPADRQTENQMDEAALAMGGFYELLYRCLRLGRPIDVPRRLGKVMEAIVEGLGASKEDLGRLRDALPLEDALIRRVNAHLESWFLRA